MATGTPRSVPRSHEPPRIAPGIQALGQPGAVLFDVKGILPLGAADARL